MYTGTSKHANEVALSQYLNPTGAGDYDLPKLTGGHFNISDSKNKNNPNYTMRRKDKLSWFPERVVNF